MKVVAWNMNHWQTRARSADGWRFLTNDLEPTVALLTEALPPTELVDAGRVAYAEVPDRGGWGSALYVAEGLALRPLEVPRVSHPGAFVAAEIHGPALEEPLTAIALYGLFDRVLDIDNCSTTLLRSLADLTELLDDLSRRGRIVLGGDLNASPARWGKRHQVVFDYIESCGLECCIEYREPATPTHRHVQIDHVFVSSELAAGVSHRDVVDVGELSDHLAIVVEVDLAAKP